ncbi:hypothetical protein NDU88_011923 [Pleurodeles waltl]|uniref:Gypsy retrotransposon integrase-like protein 1 n=1 Tax=Pleurodeles waltl TaxID=8319 RepID=A0AAV7S4Y7_PLEWA|nr:hypothetical protein NDU88_011923 [Pleurodeles waltl]
MLLMPRDLQATGPAQTEGGVLGEASAQHLYLGRIPHSLCAGNHPAPLLIDYIRGRQQEKMSKPASVAWESVTFQDVAMCFSEEDWRRMSDRQMEVCRRVMEEIHTALLSLGYGIVNSEILIRVEKGEDLFNTDGLRQGKGNGNLRPKSTGLVSNPDLLFWLKKESPMRSPLDCTGRDGGESVSAADPILRREGAFLLKKEKELTHVNHWDSVETEDRSDLNTESSYESLGLHIVVKQEKQPCLINPSDAEDEQTTDHLFQENEEVTKQKSSHSNFNRWAAPREKRRTKKDREDQLSRKQEPCAEENTLVTMDATKYKQILNYIRRNVYPDDFTKIMKHGLRRLSKNFTIDGDKLFFVGKGKKAQVIIGEEFAKQIFHQFHSSLIGGHSGITKTKKSIGSRFYWPNMTVGIEQWIKECDCCQKEQPALRISSELKPIKVKEVWELLGVDLIGPLPTTPTGNKYILTATDYFSKWVEAFPLKTKTAAEVASRLLSMYLRHGSPKRVLSDQGRDFVNQHVIQICQQASKRLGLLDFTLPTESDYVEIMDEMESKRAELQIQTKINIDIAQEKQKENNEKRVSKRYKPCTFAEGQLVLLKNSRRSTRKGGVLEPKFTGPYIITEINEKKVKLANASNVPLARTFNSDMLRPYKSSTVINTPEGGNDRGSYTLQKLHAVWDKPAMGRLEAIVSNIKLYDTSLQSLKPTEWIVDEVVLSVVKLFCV